MGNKASTLSDDFIHRGLTISQMSGVIPEKERQKFISAANEFSSFESCINYRTSDSQTDNSNYGLSPNISSLKDFEVCVFRAASFHGSATRVGEWLESIGFKVKHNRYGENHYLHGHEEISAFWDREKNKSLFPFKGGVSTFFDTLFVQSGIRVDILFLGEEVKNGVELSFSRGP